VDGGMIHLHASLGHRFLQIPETQTISRIPSDA
jgi:hypothetical protein